MLRISNFLRGLTFFLLEKLFKEAEFLSYFVSLPQEMREIAHLPYAIWPDVQFRFSLQWNVLQLVKSYFDSKYLHSQTL